MTDITSLIRHEREMEELCAIKHRLEILIDHLGDERAREALDRLQAREWGDE